MILRLKNFFLLMNKGKHNYFMLTDEELKNLEYEIAKLIDKRAYFQYYYLLIKKKHFFFCFLSSKRF